MPAPLVPAVPRRCAPLVVPLLFWYCLWRWPCIHRRPTPESQTFSGGRGQSVRQADTPLEAARGLGGIPAAPTCDRNPRCVLRALPAPAQRARAAELAARHPVHRPDRWRRLPPPAHPPEEAAFPVPPFSLLRVAGA